MITKETNELLLKYSCIANSLDTVKCFYFESSIFYICLMLVGTCKAQDSIVGKYTFFGN